MYPVQIHADFERITEVFKGAEHERRWRLFEHEVYALVAASGGESVPATRLLKRGTRLSNEEIAAFPGKKVVLKILHPAVVHKSDMGGVRIIDKTPRQVRSASRRMLDEVGERFTAYLENTSDHRPVRYEGLSGPELREAIDRDMVGVLMAEFMPPDSEAFGNELLLSLRRTREFGMVITAGLGGINTELYAERFKPGQAVVSAATELVSGEEFFRLFRSTIAYEKIAGLTRGASRLVSDEQLIEAFAVFIALGNHFSPHNPEAGYVIDELEINPFAFTDYLMVPLDGLASFSKPDRLRPTRSAARIEQLLKPESIGIIGVSATKANFGRNILTNLIKAGFDRDKIRICNPKVDQIDGISCVTGPEDLTGGVDLLVLAVSAAQVPRLIDQIVNFNLARSVILIPGGLGETEGTEMRAVQVIEKIRAAHQRVGGGPVFLGGNCLGVISRPGRYDTFFVPEEVVPKNPSEKPGPVAFISQSGAFAVSRMMKLTGGDPLYNITVGNQMDLTIGDFVDHLADDEQVGVIGIYAEGFKDSDGLLLSRGIRKAVERGREVLVYKAGRTPEGKLATSGHTASVAGDYVVCQACLDQAGALVAETFAEFDSLLNLAAALHSKKVSGNRVVGLSSAGYEAVGMADYLQFEAGSLALAELSEETRAVVRETLSSVGLDRIIGVRNPMDLTPAADDRVHAEVIRAFSRDPGVDSLVVSADTMSPGTGDLPIPSGDKDYTDSPDSFTSLLIRLVDELEKPLVVYNDVGRSHDPLNIKMERAGVPVFPTSGQAMRALAKYTAYRLRLKSLRRMAGRPTRD